MKGIRCLETTTDCGRSLLCMCLGIFTFGVIVINMAIGKKGFVPTVIITFIYLSPSTHCLMTIRCAMIHLPSIKRSASSLPSFRFISTAVGPGAQNHERWANLIMGAHTSHLKIWLWHCAPGPIMICHRTALIIPKTKTKDTCSPEMRICAVKGYSDQHCIEYVHVRVQVITQNC